MGKRVVYPPNLDDARRREIYNQSRHTPIYGYGYFLDLIKTYQELCPPDMLPHVNPTAPNFVEVLQERLVAAGLHRTYIASYRTPRRLRTEFSLDEGWLVILGTGFHKQLHDPDVSELEERVKEILCTQEPPRWWPMTTFSYPPPPA